MSDIHDEFSDLLGAYALDAVDDDERDAIERHLVGCPRCRAEVAEHREVAAFLSQSGAPAPDGVWDRIAAELSPPAPPLRMTFAPMEPEVGSEVATPVAPAPSAAPVTPIGDAPSARQWRGAPSPRSRRVAATLAVAACVVAVLGFVAVGQSQRLNKLETALDDRSVETLANDVVAHSELDVSLTGAGGSAQAVVGESGQGYLIMDDFPAPAEGDVYQLWGKVDGTVLSLGTFGADTSVVPFSVDPDRLDDIELFAVTEEKAPGVIASKNEAVIAGTV